MHYKLLLAFAMLSSAAAYPQIDTIRGEQATELLKQINKQLGIDSARFFRDAQRKACLCIDSISLKGKSRNDLVADINDCIDEQSTLLQGMIGIFKSMSGEAKDNRIEIDTDKESPQYQHYYRKLETWLRDSCKSLQVAVASHNEETSKSLSNDPKARREYNEGVEWMKKNEFAKALKYFEKAVKADDEFAFAWDNIGVCNRRLGNLDEALKAYKKSLEIDPEGVMPLHNIPIVYEFQKKYELAIKAYQELVEKHPKDPEGYYGQGRMYVNLNEMDKALQNMCKAYNLYVDLGSPYRVDAEKNINYIYSKMKEEGKEKRFFEILKENNIKTQE